MFNALDINSVRRLVYNYTVAYVSYYLFEHIYVTMQCVVGHHFPWHQYSHCILIVARDAYVAFRTEGCVVLISDNLQATPGASIAT